MKNLIIPLICLAFSVSAQTHRVKFNSPEYINYNYDDSVLTVNHGSSIELDITMERPWSIGNLQILVNDVLLEAEIIDVGHYKTIVEDIQKNTEIIFSIVSRPLESRIVKYKSENLGKEYLSIRIPKYNDLYSYIYTLHQKEEEEEWIIAYQELIEPIPSPPSFRSDQDSISLALMPQRGLLSNTEYYVSIDYFHRFPSIIGKPIVLLTATSPSFTLEDYGITNNLIIEQNKVKIYSSKGFIYIETDNYPTNLSVYSISGKFINSQLINEKYTLVPIPPGIYIVSITEKTVKIIVE